MPVHEMATDGIERGELSPSGAFSHSESAYEDVDSLASNAS